MPTQLYAAVRPLCSDQAEDKGMFEALNWVRDQTFTISDPSVHERAFLDAMSVASMIMRDGGNMDQQIAGIVLGSGFSEPTAQAIRKQFGNEVARILQACLHEVEIEDEPLSSRWLSCRLHYLSLLSKATSEVFTVVAAFTVHRTVLSASRLATQIQQIHVHPGDVLMQHSCYQVRLLKCLLKRTPGSSALPLLTQSIKSTLHLCRETSMVLPSFTAYQWAFDSNKRHAL